jgi:VWFA-related protein
MTRLLLIALICFGADVGRNLSSGNQQKPVFKSGVELVRVDVQVVDNHGFPIADLKADAFDVAIDGKKRQVVSAEMFRYTGTSRRAEAPTEEPRPDEAPQSRVIIMAVDELSFRTFGVQAAMQSARQFLDRAQPDDLIGLYAFPKGGVLVQPTRDRRLLLDALPHIVGLQSRIDSQFHLSLSEVMDITAFDNDVVSRVAQRECPTTPPTVVNACRRDIARDAQNVATTLEMEVAQSLGGLQGLVADLGQMPGRKIVILISGGLIANDRSGSRPDVKSEMQAIGRRMATTNSNLYLLHIDNNFIDQYSAARGERISGDVSREATAMARGLELLCANAGGTLVRLESGTAESTFDRVLNETSAYYLLGVSPEDDDRDGRMHSISVKLKQRNASVQSRKMVLIPRK